MNPRRLHSATTLSRVTLSVSAFAITRRVSVAAMPWLTSRNADLRVPLRERSRLRGDPEHVRRPRAVLRGVRVAGRARLPPRGGPLQGVRLLQHRLQGEGGREGEGRKGGRGRRRLRGL